MEQRRFESQAVFAVANSLADADRVCSTLFMIPYPGASPIRKLAACRVRACLWVLSAAGFLNGSAVHATPYTIETELSWADHYDEYAYTYTPGAGWSSVIIGGDNSEIPGKIEVLASDGSTGQLVNVQLTFRVAYESFFENEFLSSDRVSNFAGFSSGAIANSVSAYSQNFAGPGFQRDVQVPFSTLGYKDYTIEVPIVVGPLVLGPYDDGYWVWLGGHVEFLPTGLQVIDPDKYAEFGIYADMTVSLVDAKVVGVPDGGLTAFMLASALAGLIWIRRGNLFMRSQPCVRWSQTKRAGISAD